MTRFSPLIACVATILPLSGCAADYTTYPSLARRSAERVSGTIAVAPPVAAPQPPAPPPSADLVTLLGQLGDRAQAAHHEFTGRRARAEQLVAAAGKSPVGSDGWAQASVALADLETARSQAMIALADLDELYTAARVEGGEATTIAATRDRVIDLIGEEDIVLAQLRGRIAS